MQISLIISTYNWPEALAVCLKSVLNQTLTPFEVIIADDGSDERTKAVVDNFSALSQCPVKHVWQPDEGFRAGTIRNKAIAVCESDYIVQIDRDLILNPYFLADHARAARSGYFVSGGRINLTQKFSAKLLENQSIYISFWSRGLSISKRFMSLRCYPLSLILRGHKAHTYRYGLGCNMAFWRGDVFAINGYDNSFVGWGGEDSDLMCRLMIAGIKKSSLRLNGIAFHLYHKTLNVSEISARNFSKVDENALSSTGICKDGIVKF